jgi:hypothetical protein
VWFVDDADDMTGDVSFDRGEPAMPDARADRAEDRRR